MELKVQKQILDNILTNLQPFLEKKDITAITSHILIKNENDSLEFYATDYEIGLLGKSSDYFSMVQGRATANGKKFLDVVRRLKEGEITLKCENDNLVIIQEKSRFKLPMFNAEEFPVFPDFTHLPKIEIESAKLIQSIKKIIPAIDTNNPKYELNGALIDIKEYSLNFVATDTRRLALVKFDNPSISKLSLIIPKKAIVEIQKLFFEDIELYYDDTNLIIRSENYLFYTKLINGKYPDYERIIPKEIKNRLLVPKDRVVESIKLITSISNEIKIEIGSENIKFESMSNENSEAKTEFSFASNLQTPITFAVNSRYLLDFLSQIESNEFALLINEGNLPFVLESDNFKTIVMPIIL